MWTAWNPTVIADDFVSIRADGFDTVRITTFPDTFGYPQPDPIMVDRLRQTVSMAAAHGLRVQLSLFDQFTGWPDIGGSIRWGQAILRPFQDDARIAFVDIRNEIDPGVPAEMSWLKSMIAPMRSALGRVPLGVSVRGADAEMLTEVVGHVGRNALDLYALHYFGPDGLAYATMRAAIAAVRPAPLIIGETGLSTDATASGVEATSQAREAYQDHYYRVLEWATASLDLPFAAPWTYWDFGTSGVPADLAPSQKRYGLRRVDGSPKPALVSLSTMLHSGIFPLDFNNGMEQTSGPVATIAAVWRVWRPQEATFVRDTSVAHTGRSSLRISRSRGTDTAVPAFYATPVDAWVQAGDRCRASVWVRGRALTGRTRIGITWFDGRGAFIGQVESGRAPHGTSGWRELVVDGIAPTRAAYAEIDLKSPGNRGDVWFDDVGWTKS
jgi:hypothetical protein